jgi:hypothetical protein
MLISIDDITTFITLFYYNINKNNINANTMWITILNCHLDEYMFVKSHFADKERLLRKDLEQIRKQSRD